MQFAHEPDHLIDRGTILGARFACVADTIIVALSRLFVTSIRSSRVPTPEGVHVHRRLVPHCHSALVQSVRCVHELPQVAYVHVCTLIGLVVHSSDCDSHAVAPFVNVVA